MKSISLIYRTCISNKKTKSYLKAKKIDKKVNLIFIV